MARLSESKAFCSALSHFHSTLAFVSFQTLLARFLVGWIAFRRKSAHSYKILTFPGWRWNHSPRVASAQPWGLHGALWVSCQRPRCHPLCLHDLGCRPGAKISEAFDKTLFAVMVVRFRDSSAIGIWWKAFMRSSFKKKVEPLTIFTRSSSSQTLFFLKLCSLFVRHMTVSLQTHTACTRQAGSASTSCYCTWVACGLLRSCGSFPHQMQFLLFWFVGAIMKLL